MAKSAKIAGASSVIEVVCALLVRRGKILVALRLDDGDEPAFWEFPGGKVEVGENHTQALTRECKEELGVDIRVGPLAWDLDYPRANKAPLRLWFYFATLRDESHQPQALAAQELAWLSPDAFDERPFCPGDAPMIAALRAKKLSIPNS